MIELNELAKQLAVAIENGTRLRDSDGRETIVVPIHVRPGVVEELRVPQELRYLLVRALKEWAAGLPPALAGET